MWYAAKCNTDIKVIETCAKAGTGFDVASVAEMQAVLGLGVDPQKLIFANPVKSIHQLKAAKKLGVKRMTFDSIEELYKI